MQPHGDHPTIASVQLAVGGLDRAIRFYSDVLGLQTLDAADGAATLGVHGRGFLHLRERPGKSRADPRRPGLFHVAYLLPTRNDLAAFARHLAAREGTLTGASDHGVSEALYFGDPDGHGIEVYADRPREAWREGPDGVAMPTRPLDVAALAAGGGAWRGAPNGTSIGHVHLRVGDLDAGERFIRERLGMTLRHSTPDARWFAWNGYHHHLAINSWHSRGGTPDAGALGLEAVHLTDGLSVDDGGLVDPTGVAWWRAQPNTPR